MWVAINGWNCSPVGKSHRHSQTKDMFVLSESKAFIMEKDSNETFRISNF